MKLLHALNPLLIVSLRFRIIKAGMHALFINLLHFMHEVTLIHFRSLLLNLIKRSLIPWITQCAILFGCHVSFAGHSDLPMYVNLKPNTVELERACGMQDRRKVSPSLDPDDLRRVWIRCQDLDLVYNLLAAEKFEEAQKLFIDPPQD